MMEDGDQGGTMVLHPREGFQVPPILHLLFHLHTCPLTFLRFSSSTLANIAHTQRGP